VKNLIGMCVDEAATARFLQSHSSTDLTLSPYGPRGVFLGEKIIKCIVPLKMVNPRTNGTISKCSSIAFQ
jgi:hypothetical protein